MIILEWMDYIDLKKKSDFVGKICGDGKKNATVVKDVYIHPSAKVHPTAKIGPNVSISANVCIAAGARLISCIVLDDVEIKENAVVMHAIIGWKSSLGRWSRVQADGDYNTKFGITILGEAATVEDEVVVINRIVLPNKMLNVYRCYNNSFEMGRSS